MSTGGSNNSNNGGGGPCGACKFLRRKCVKGCVFAAHFDSAERGAAQFAAVHKVFGASNASKLLLRLPPHLRPDAVASLSYEALARLRDPVYGASAHVLTLQQQVVNLQAELACVQARLSILHHLPPLPPLPQPHDSSPESTLSSTVSMHLDPSSSIEMATSCGPGDFLEELDDGDFHALAREFVSRYLPGVRLWPPSSH